MQGVMRKGLAGIQGLSNCVSAIPDEERASVHSSEPHSAAQGFNFHKLIDNGAC